LYHYRRHLTSVCATRFEQMCGLIEQVMAEAYARRGLGAPPPLSELRPELGRPDSVAQTFRNWACHAIENRNLRLARHHATEALRRDPWSLQSWRVLYWTIAA